MQDNRKQKSTFSKTTKKNSDKFWKCGILIFMYVDNSALFVYINFVCVEIFILELKYSAVVWK